MSAQQLGVSFFYCENTLAPTYIEDIPGNPLKIEMILNEKASIDNVKLFSTLYASNSFVENASIPVNYTVNTTQTVQITNGTDTRDLQISAKKINRRNAPFTICFTERFNPSDWIKATTGWASIGVKDSDRGIMLDTDYSVFLLAFNNNQGLLSFDISGENLLAYQGVFSVESSVTGVDDWEPIFFVDNCHSNFKLNQYTVNLKIENDAKYIRFVSQTGNNQQPIYLNNFSIGAYNGEDVDNATSVKIIEKSAVRLYSNFVKNELQILGLEDKANLKYTIFSLEGKIYSIGKTSNSRIVVNQLPDGIYFIQINSEEGKTLKFFKSTK